MTKPRTHMLILFFVALLIYNANFRAIGTGDSIPTSLIPIVLLTRGNIVMNEFNKYYSGPSGTPYFFHETKFGYLPTYPLATGILLTPFYIIPVYWLAANNPTISDWVHFARNAEKISASVITAVSAALFYLLAIQLGASFRAAFVVSLSYAFASEAWSTSSQALWQHGPGIFFMLLAGSLALRQMENPTTRRAIFLGLACGVAVAIRPTNILFIFLLYLWMIKKCPLYFTAYTVPAAILASLLLGYNYIVFGSVRGRYTGPFNMPVLDGLKGLLFSPGRGLLLYFPLALFGPLGFCYAMHNRVRYMSFYSVLMAFVVLQVVLVSKWHMWWGGWSFGPRMLTEIQPMLLLLSLPFFALPINKYKKWIGFYILLIWCLSVQFVGASIFPAGNWNSSPTNVDKTPSRLWDWKDNPVSRDVSTIGYRYRVKPKPLSDYKATYDVNPKIIISLPGETKDLSVLVTNTSSEPWPNFGKLDGSEIVHLSYHIVDHHGKMLRYDGNRVGFNRVVWPGESMLLSLPVQAPLTAGQYAVEISLVQEGVAWFDDKGISPAKVDIIVKK